MELGFFQLRENPTSNSTGTSVDAEVDAGDLAAERWEGAPGCGRQGWGDGGGRVEQGDEAEEGMRARGEAEIEMQGVQRLSAREEALSVQGVRWGLNLRARSCTLYV